MEAQENKADDTVEGSPEFLAALQAGREKFGKIWAFRKVDDGDAIEVVFRKPSAAHFDRFLGMSAEKTHDVNPHFRQLVQEVVTWCNHPSGLKGLFDEYPMIASEIGGCLIDIAKGDRPKVARRFR